ncbi:MAG TPA: hypothetical protein P5121_05160 [Caldilineaceae bacterium]|nr:hypothetical protein [Caldilineaceae bacterium]
MNCPYCGKSTRVSSTRKLPGLVERRRTCSGDEQHNFATKEILTVNGQEPVPKSEPRMIIAKVIDLLRLMQNDL